MKQQISDKIFGYIDALASKLGVASEYIMKILVRQEIIANTVELIAFAIAIVALLFWIRFTYQWLEKDRTFNTEKPYGYGHKREAAGIAFGVSAVIGGIAIAIMFACSVISCIHLLNPEYYAIRTILDVVSGK
jgi:hypothetical protein